MGVGSSRDFWASRTEAIEGLQQSLSGEAANIGEDFFDIPDWRVQQHQESVVDFFNRTQELSRLLDCLSRRPSSVFIVVGPRDCGKTCLLKRLRELWYSQSLLVATSPIFYVDMRELSWKTPQDAAAQLMEAFRQWSNTIRDLTDRAKAAGRAFTLNIPGVVNVNIDKVMDAFCERVKQQSDLSSLMSQFTSVVAANPAAFPIFILDEADRLKNWDPADLKTFMGCFASMGKQNRRTFLLLSSSDDFFRSWLRCMFTPDQWEAIGVGCFSKEDARMFFEGHCIPQARGAPLDRLDDSEWEDVYGICGGSPLLLRQCAEVAARAKLSLVEAADVWLQNHVCNVLNALAATQEDNGFDGERYKLIAQAIIQKGFISHHTVMKEIYKRDKATCKKEVLAMLRQKYIHIRYITPSTLYSDISYTSLSAVEKQSELLMATSPAQRAAMRRALELD